MIDNPAVRTLWMTDDTLLDYFAAQVLVAMGNWTPSFPTTHYHGSDEWVAEAHGARAKYAYDQAEAMLKERQSR